jgi:hypothetical protein
MTLLRRGSLFCICLLLCTVALAQSDQSKSSQQPSQTTDRLFLSFAEDASVIPGQWWEGQLGLFDGESVDATILQLVVALQPYRNLEIGGTVGFGDTDGPGSFPDGSGATDLDVWGKWNFGSIGRNRNTEFAVGALATVPTGDDTAGLGEDAFHLGVFGSLRHRMEGALVTGHAGVRANGNGNISGFPLEGKTSAVLGAAVIIPFRDRLSVVGETKLETERFEGGDDDFRVLGGLNWHATSRGVFRGAIGLGLTDAAPDAQIVVGYAHTF